MKKKLLVSILVLLFARFTPSIIDSKINGSVNPSETLQTAANVAWGVSAVIQFSAAVFIISVLVLAAIKKTTNHKPVKTS